MIDHISELCWLQRGGLTRDEAWNLSHRERQRILRQAQQRMKVVEKTKLPLL